MSLSFESCSSRACFSEFLDTLDGLVRPIVLCHYFELTQSSNNFSWDRAQYALDRGCHLYNVCRLSQLTGGRSAS